MTDKKNFNIEKLSDDTLENISGGALTLEEKLYSATFNVTILAEASSTACLVASAIYQSKASTALKNGDTKQCDKFNKISRKFAIGAACCGALRIGSSIANRAVFHHYHH